MLRRTFMNEPLARHGGSAENPGRYGYSLQSDLARLCLPAAVLDSNRKLAWVNSICFLFLLIGGIGIKSPGIIVRPLSDVADLVPVVFTPPAEPPKSEPNPQPETEEPEPETPAETPQVATVVAPDVGVQFAIPVEGPVIIAASPRYVPPPPRELPKATPNPGPPQPVRFRPGTDGGRYPDPSYPRAALASGHQGRVLLLIQVDPSGTVLSSEVKDTSGYSTLDYHAARWVKSRWQFPPGESRLYECEIHFKLQQ